MSTGRTYRAMLSAMPLNQRDSRYRETLAYLRALYAEFGRAAVREAMR
jgi:hypothetical protein